MNFIYALNFKMNKTATETKEYMQKFDSQNRTVIICAPFTSIFEIKNNHKDALIGAQNVSEFTSGAHTGEIDAKMLADLGVKYCIVGHSERRKFNHETDEQIAEKIARLVEQNITPILCVGEPNKMAFEESSKFVENQIKLALKNVQSPVIVAYEPVWAIGTGDVPTNEQIENMCEFIHKCLNELNIQAKVLYGGSYNSKNYKTINNAKFVDGFLIGGAGLKLDEMELIYKG